MAESYGYQYAHVRICPMCDAPALTAEAADTLGVSRSATCMKDNILYVHPLPERDP